MISKKSCILLLAIALLFWNILSGIAQTKAPEFTLTDINGESFSLSDYLGKVVILDFFDTLCSGCIEQFEHLRVLDDTYPDRLVLISISVSPEYDTNERLQSFALENDMQWLVARDTMGVSNDYNIQILPTLIIIDADGYIGPKHEVSVDWTVLTTEIDNILSGTNINGSDWRIPIEMIILMSATGVASIVVIAVLLKRRKHQVG